MEIHPNISREARRTHDLIDRIQRMQQDPDARWDADTTQGELLTGLINIVGELEIAVTTLTRAAAKADRDNTLADHQRRMYGG
ncbi:hypothetical protein L2K20_06135 [Mycobacterium sp. MBM]|nr:hypothetical protein [Mycobacterium sp. MBM]